MKYISAKTIGHAIMAHAKTNHEYDGMPYSVHLIQVIFFMYKYLYLLPESVWEGVLIAGWHHDTIEDARLTYNDIKKKYGKWVADLVYAVTNNRGKNRDERANDEYYELIRETPWACFIKLCDRLANVSHAKETRHGMFYGYKDENEHFLERVLTENQRELFKPMTDELESLFTLDQKVEHAINEHS